MVDFDKVNRKVLRGCGERLCNWATEIEKLSDKVGIGTQPRLRNIAGYIRVDGERLIRIADTANSSEVANALSKT